MVGVTRGVVGESRGSVLSVSHGELLTRGKIIIIKKVKLLVANCTGSTKCSLRLFAAPSRDVSGRVLLRFGVLTSLPSWLQVQSLRFCALRNFW